MTIEEAKKAGFKTAWDETTSIEYVLAWAVSDYAYLQVLKPARSLGENDFQTRAMARAEQQKRRDAQVAAHKAAGMQVPPTVPTETPAEKDARIKALVDGYKAKAEAEPLEWCEYNEGYRLSPEAFISFDDGKTWTTVTGKFIGVCYSECLGIRARYRNPLWLAKHGKDVESHETPVGETQGKEVVTDETQHSPSRPLSDAEFKKLVGRMSLPQLYDALKANGVKLEGIGLEPKNVDEQSVLEEAAKCVTGPRRRDYGTPEENFSLIAKLWSLQLKHEVTSMQVAMCLILLKVARQANSPKRDNLVDIAGYAQCASELKGAK